MRPGSAAAHGDAAARARLSPDTNAFFCFSQRVSSFADGLSPLGWYIRRDGRRSPHVGGMRPVGGPIRTEGRLRGPPTDDLGEYLRSMEVGFAHTRLQLEERDMAQRMNVMNDG